MKNLHQKQLLGFILLALISCSKHDLTVIYNDKIIGNIQLDTLFDIIEIKDGFILSGINNSRITISKLDENFGTVWKKDNYKWGHLFSEGGWGGAFYSVDIVNVLQDENENLICFCAVMEGGDVIWNSALIVTLDKLGNETNRIELKNYTLINVFKTGDQGYLLFGGNLLKLNPDLSKAWKNDDQNYAFSGAYITPTDDDGCAVTGTLNNDKVFLQKFDESGIKQWTKSDFNRNPFSDLGFDIHQVENGGFMIIGRTQDIKEPWDMNCFVIRTDLTGDTIWTKKFGEETNEWLGNFIYASDDDYILKETIGFSGDPIQKTILVRISGNGQITESKETSNFEKILYTTSGYFIKAEQNGGDNITLSKISFQDLFE